jgi:hypothetical protein
MAVEIIKDFFTKDEIKGIRLIIKKAVESRKTLPVKPEDVVRSEHSLYNFHYFDNSRLCVYDIDYSPYSYKITELINQRHPGAQLISNRYIEYSKDWGSAPELPMHKDGGKEFEKTKQIMFDYQLDSNIDWDLIAGEDLISLNNNDACIFNPYLIEHGRPSKNFNDRDYKKNILFFYSY